MAVIAWIDPAAGDKPPPYERTPQAGGGEMPHQRC
jgi:hypothetical protein